MISPAIEAVYERKFEAYADSNTPITMRNGKTTPDNTRIGSG